MNPSIKKSKNSSMSARIAAISMPYWRLVIGLWSICSKVAALLITFLHTSAVMCGLHLSQASSFPAFIISNHRAPRLVQRGGEADERCAALGGLAGVKHCTRRTLGLGAVLPQFGMMPTQHPTDQSSMVSCQSPTGRRVIFPYWHTRDSGSLTGGA